MPKKKKQNRKPRTAQPGGDAYKPRRQTRRQRVLVTIVVVALVVAMGAGALAAVLTPT